MRNNTSFYLIKSITTVLLHVMSHNCLKMHRNVGVPDYRSLFTQTWSGMDTGYDICESDSLDSLRGLGIDIIGRVHFDNRDRFSISMGRIGKATKPWQQTTEWLLTSDFWLFLEPRHARWYEYEILLLRVQTAYVYDLENERWLFGDMIDHVGIYESRVAEVCRRPTSVLFKLPHLCDICGRGFLGAADRLQANCI